MNDRPGVYSDGGQLAVAVLYCLAFDALLAVSLWRWLW